MRGHDHHPGTTVVLELSGVQWASEKGPRGGGARPAAGVARVDVKPVAQSATVTFDPERTSVAELRDWIVECGYHCAGESVPHHVCDTRHPVAPVPSPHDAMGHGGHGGMSMAAMVRDMRNRFPRSATCSSSGPARRSRSTATSSTVTGESLPVHEQPGSAVVGATINRNGTLRVRATKVGTDTALAQRSSLYDTIALPIAAGAFEPTFGLVLHPEIAALSMSGSSVLVTVNALLLERLRLLPDSGVTARSGFRGQKVCSGGTAGQRGVCHLG